MAKRKVTVTLDKKLLLAMDRLIILGIYPDRSSAIEQAVQEKLKRISHDRLARECARLDPQIEKAMAEEGMHSEP